MPLDGTRARQIVDMLMLRGPMTIAELVDSLGVTTTAVRQHVDRLVAEDWVVRAVRRGGPGRPAHVLSVSEKTRRVYGSHCDELSRMLVEEIVRTEGPGKARELLHRVSRRMAEQSRHAVGDGSPSQRVRNLARHLNGQGMLVETRGSEHGMRLAVYTCPYPDLAAEHREICEMERETVSELVGDNVRLSQCMYDGHQCCEFEFPATSDPDAPRTGPCDPAGGAAGGMLIADDGH